MLNKFWLSKDEAQRLRQIAHVLYKHKLGHILARLRLRSKLPLEKNLKKEHFEKQEITPVAIREIIEDLDGSFIKLGQLLALRPDLIPPEYCDEMSKLQDEVKPFPGSEAVSIIENELKKPVKKLFASFDEKPTAAASMGQVHVAKLHDGTKVAVKVQRPDAERTVKTDIKLLYRLARIISKRFGTDQINPAEIVREFERYTENELNYLKEAHNIDRFHQNFEKSKTIIIPKVFWHYTTSRVVTMEYIQGRRLTDLKLKAREGKKIVDTILNAEYEQIFHHGIFHADPHPGNFILKKNGKVALLDFGIVGRLDPAFKEHITEYFIALIDGNVEDMVTAAVNMGVVGEEANIRQLRDDIREGLSPYHNTAVEKIKISKVLHTTLDIFKKHKLTISPNFVLLLKATVTLESVTLKLDPTFNMVQRSKPFVKKLARERLNPKNIVKNAARKVETMLQFAEAIPRKTNTFITELQDTDRDIKRLHNDLGSLTVEIDKSSNRVTLGFIAGTMFIASTILLPYQTFKIFGMPLLSMIGYIVALIITLVILFSMLGEKRIKQEVS